MDLQPLAIGQRLLVGGRRQSCVDSRRRRRHDLAEEMFAHEKSALGGRRIRRLAGQGEEGCLARGRRRAWIRAEVHAVELARRGAGTP